MDSIVWFGDPPDVVIVTGDLSEGIDKKFDVSNPMILSQMRMAAEAISLWCAKKEYILITGTVAHTTAQLQEMEEHAAAIIQSKQPDVKVSIRRKLNTSINGWFNLQARHFIGGSAIPHGRATAPLRSQLWQDLNSFLKSTVNGTPARRTHLHIFGHVHYYTQIRNARGCVVTMPCWKALGDKFGEEICDGAVDMGTLKLIVGDTEEEGWSLSERLYLPGVISRMESR